MVPGKYKLDPRGKPRTTLAGIRLRATLRGDRGVAEAQFLFVAGCGLSSSGRGAKV
jgi:hypothetical protein